MQKLTTKEKTIKSIPWVVFGRVSKYIINFVTSIIVVRWLGKELYGEYTIVRNVMTIICMISLAGVEQAVLRFIPTLTLKNNKDEIKKLLVRSFSIQVIIWLICLLVIFIIKPTLSQMYKIPESYFIIGAIVIFFNVIYWFCSNTITGFFDNKYFSLIDITEGLLKLITVSVLFYLNYKVLSVIIGWQLSFLIMSIFVYFRIKGNIKKISQPSIAENSAHAEIIGYKRLLKYSIPLMLTNILIIITWKQTEVFFLGYYIGKAEAGLFDLAFQNADLIINFLPLSLLPVWMATSAEQYTLDKNNLKKTIKWHYNLLFLVAAPMSIGGALIMDKVIILLYGKEMAAAGLMCQLFFIIFALSFFGAPLSLAIYVIEKSGVNLFLYVIYAVIKIGLDFICIQRWGYYGAIFPVFFVITLSSFVRYYVAKRYIGTFHIPWDFIGKSYLCSLPIILIAPLRYWGNSISGLLGLVVIGMLIYVVAARYFGLIGSDLKEYILKSKMPLKEKMVKVLCR